MGWTWLGRPDLANVGWIWLGGPELADVARLDWDELELAYVVWSWLMWDELD